MNKFALNIIKLSAIFGIVIAVLLLALGGVLLLAPEFIFKVLYYGLIIGCFVISGYLLISSIYILIQLIRVKK